MANTLTIKLTRPELEELRIAAEIQLAARRTDITSREESLQYRSLESAHRKVMVRIAAFAPEPVVSSTPREASE